MDTMTYPNGLLTPREARLAVGHPDIKAAQKWLREAKRRGAVTILGGGWWKIGGWHRPVQGYAALAIELRKRGEL